MYFWIEYGAGLAPFLEPNGKAHLTATVVVDHTFTNHPQLFCEASVEGDDDVIASDHFEIQTLGCTHTHSLSASLKQQ